MNEENKNEQLNEKTDEPEKGQNKTFAFVAIGLVLAGAVAFGVSFTVLGIYALIASLIFEMGAMTFLNVQKKKCNFKWLLYIKIAAYAIFIAAISVFAIGTIWAAQN